MIRAFILASLLCSIGVQAADRAALEARAAKGDTAAQFELAHALYWAKGMERDLEASASWAQRAAEAGHAKARFLHAIQLLLAHGTKGDSKAGFDTLILASPALEKAAGQGDPQALYFTAQLYIWGYHPANQFKQDLKLAHQRMTAAAEQGNIEATYRLGLEIYQNSTHNPANTAARAAKWLRQAAQAGHPYAAHLLGEMHLKDDLGPADAQKAGRWLKQAAESGLAQSQQLYGNLLAGKALGQPDRKAALKWFQIAANQGYGPAQQILAWIYLEGKDVEKNLEQASVWLTLLERQTDLNKGDAQLKKSLATQLTPDQSLAVLRRVGEFKPQPSAVTRADSLGLLGSTAVTLISIREDLLNRLSEEGDAEAAQTLGLSKLTKARQLIAYGNRLRNEAAQLARANTEPSRLLAQENIANADQAEKAANSIFLEARKLLTFSAENNQVSAQRALADMCLAGQGMDPSPLKAVEWLERAAKQNDNSALWMLVDLYRQGGAVKKNLPRAFQILQQLADRNEMGALSLLGVCYINGEGVEQDLAKAGDCFLKAALRGHPLAQVHLGYYHLKGHGKKGVDYPEAFKWLSLAARQGEMSAQIAVGMMHHDGNGLPRDSMKGYEWLLIAERNFALADPQTQKILADEKLRLEQFKQKVAAPLSRAHMQAARDRALKFKPVDLYRPGQSESADAKTLLARANTGEAEAQYQLAFLCLRGLDGNPDPVQAYKWFTLAKEAGHALAGVERDQLSQSMENRQIIEAKKLARKFKPLKPGQD